MAENTITRRSFVKGLLGTGAVVAALGSTSSVTHAQVADKATPRKESFPVKVKQAARTVEVSSDEA